MDFDILIKLTLCALLPVGLSVAFYFLKKLTKFNKLPDIAQQIIIGICFGGVAIFGTECGVPIGTATANVRDAAPLCAGLIFGPVAGIISGAIGAVERFFAAYWGRGTYSQIACTVSTFIAGVYAGALRHHMFEDKRPSWGFGLCIGAVMEVLHLTILLLTHLEDPETAANILKILGIPMVAANAFAVFAACLILQLVQYKPHQNKGKIKRISQQVQTYLLALIVLAYAMSFIFTYSIQTSFAYNAASNLLEQNINDVKDSVKKSCDTRILSITKNIKTIYEDDTSINLTDLAILEDIEEISVIDSNGIIVKSNVPAYIGYDMEELGGQAAEFNVLLDNVDELVQAYGPIASDNSTYRKYAGVYLAGGGYIQIGLSQEQFHKVVEGEVDSLSENRHIGQSGYVLIANYNEIIVSINPQQTLGSLLIKLDEKDEFIRYDSSVGQTDNNVACSIMYSMAEGFYIIGVYPNEEVFSSRDSMLYILSFMEIIAFAILFALIYFLIKKLVVEKISSINKTLGQIINGDLSVEMNVRTSAEFSSLSDDINSTVSTLKVLIDEAAKRIDNELAFAKTIQASALPIADNIKNKYSSFDLNASMHTAKEVGGDFYDFYMLDENHLGFLIADVSGKGIPAAMFMMESKTMIKNLSSKAIPVNEIITLSNNGLCQGNDAQMFVTCWMGILNLDTGHLAFTNAGHNKPLIYRKEQDMWEYGNQLPGFVLGGLEGFKYRQQDLYLKNGDRVFLFTDGVTEATRTDNALYGEERLINFLNSHKGLSIEETLKQVKDDLDNFVEGAQQFDDITMLMVDFFGPEGKKGE